MGSRPDTKTAREDLDDVYPCTPFQEGLMAISKASPGAYVAHLTYALPDDVDEDRFRQAWVNVVLANPILRTRIVNKGSKGSLQLVHKDEFTWRSVTAVDPAELRKTATRMTYGAPLTSFWFVRDADGSKTLIWTAHHAIYDGWTVSSILDQVKAHYLQTDVPRTLPYNQYVRWIQATDDKKSEEFWQKRLPDSLAPAFPPLPHEGYQPKTNQYAEQTVEMPTTGTRDQYEIPMVIRAAWALLMSRYLQSDSVLFGSISSGRGASLQGIRAIAGPTVATFPVRVELGENITVRDLLDTLRREANEMETHEHWGLHRIAKLKPNGPARSKFQTLLVTQRGTSRANQSSTSDSVDNDNNTSTSFFRSLTETDAGFHSYPLVIECRISEGTTEVALEAQYDDGVLQPWQMQRLLAQFAYVIRQIALAGLPSSTINTVRDIDVFSPEDSALMQQWTAAAASQSPPTMTAVESCVHSLVEEQVRARPEGPAVSSWDGALSYQELDDLSSRLAGHLIVLGVGPESKIPICTERSLWAIVAILAVLKTGAAFVPLDTAVPAGRLETVVGATGATLALASPTKYDLLNDNRSLEKVVEISPAAAKRWPPPYSAVSDDPASVAYVMFTSGSTGKPKGVVMDHRAVCTSMRAHGRGMNFGVDTRALHFASLAFDATIAEILTTLIHGGCVCIPSDDQRLSNVSEAIRQHQVNWAFFTPSVARLIDPDEVPSLKTLVLGGEALKKGVLEQWVPRVNVMGGYGPTEACVFCVQTDTFKQAQIQQPDIIGRAIGSTAWVVSLTNEAQLAAVGSIGELWVEGPQLARGYLSSPDATAKSFFTDPPFLRHVPPESGSGRRLYKTGDLVQYVEDGTLRFIGRQDNNVKVRGQRVELAEIEHELHAAGGKLQEGMIVFPKQGPLAGRVTAVIELGESTADKVGGGKTVVKNGNLIALQGTRLAAAQLQVNKIQQILAQQLPSFMIPTAWFAVESIPFTSSGKLDRAQVSQWLTSMDTETLQSELTGPEQDGANTSSSDIAAKAATPAEEMLRRACADVLNLPVEKISLARSFLNLGGDSITAMQLASRCRAEKAKVSVPDILRSSSLSQLALLAGTLRRSKIPRDEPLNQPFELSPIQELYFGLGPEAATARFNQSFLVRITRHKDVMDVARAVEALVSQHSMLRARFSHCDGRWQQTVTTDAQSSFEFTVHKLPREQSEASSSMSAVMVHTQAKVNAQTGPLFVVNLFEQDGSSESDGRQILFLVAHHLVVDLVSWRILLQQLEELLETGKLSAERPVPFQVWNSLQREFAQRELTPEAALPFSLPPSDLQFWGIEGQNVWGDVKMSVFSLTEDTTSRLLGDCNNAFGTEPIDIFTAALLHSFGKVFTERKPPTIFTEGHGREPWDEEIDLSGTVGWFTTIKPIVADVDNEDVIIDTLQRVKDARRALPSGGWAYFASRFLNSRGRQVFGASQNTIEVMFNYLGRFQQLERQGALFEQETRPGGFEVADMGYNTPRIAAIDASASVNEGKASLSISYSNKSSQIDRIIQWGQEWELALVHLAKILPPLHRRFTRSDLPLVDLTEGGLQRFLDVRLPAVGVKSIDEIDDVYACSPLQDGILVSQSQNPGYYNTQFAFQVSSQEGAVDVDRLKAAWQSVVDRHDILRTIFFEGVSANGLFTQVVLKYALARVAMLPTTTDGAESDDGLGRPDHKLLINEAGVDGNVECRLEINHALVDGASIPIIFGDLARAYEGSLPPGQGPSYGAFIAYLASVPKDIAVKYWSDHLSGLEPCHFPRLAEMAASPQDVATQSTEAPTTKTISIDLEGISNDMNVYCAANDVTCTNIIHAAWALVLRAYTGLEHVSFGYLVSGRDVPVDKVEETAGPFVNMLAARLEVQACTNLRSIVAASKKSYAEALPHQSSSLAEVQHALGLSGQVLFNTVLSVQSTGSVDEGEAPPPGLEFRSIGGEDPTEVSTIPLNTRS